MTSALSPTQEVGMQSSISSTSNHNIASSALAYKTFNYWETSLAYRGKREEPMQMQSALQLLASVTHNLGPHRRLKAKADVLMQNLIHGKPRKAKAPKKAKSLKSQAKKEA